MKVFLFFLFFSPMLFYGQSNIVGFTFDNVPQNLQLYARNGNSAEVVIDGQYDKSGGLTEYDEISFVVDNNRVIAQLVYSGNIATFTHTTSISADTINHTFKIETRTIGGSWQNVTEVNNVVAGDVYIIYGQSNALAQGRNSATYDPPSGSSNDFKNDFIRVFERSSPDTTRNKWYIGQGDGGGGTNGNTGQWGLVLAKSIIDNYGVPVAIFNGAVGGTTLTQLMAPLDYATSLVSPYGKLFYRLNKTGLSEKVKAVFWSQGETSGGSETYYQDFNLLIESLENDYKNMQKIYIFQTKNGCDSDGPPADPLKIIKESQRRLAVDHGDYIDIMPTSALRQFYDDCHFYFEDGYEMFAKRIFELVAREFYGEPEPNTIEIKAPMITKAYLEDTASLIIETDAKFDLKPLELIGNEIPTNFEISSSNGVVIEKILVDGSRIKFDLSGDPGINSEISYSGQNQDVDIDNFIKNNNDLELICFNKFPIDTSLKTIWDGIKWNPAAPLATMDAVIDGQYNVSDGSIESRDLTVNSNKTVDFDSNSGGVNNIVVYGDLNVAGTMIIGDTESLVMPNSTSNATVEAATGTFRKLEKTTILDNQYDVTYFSSPVASANLSTTFPNVDVSRMFHYDPTIENLDYSLTYPKYRYWHKATGPMLPGKGYSIDGETTTISGQKMSVSFEGVPNHGEIKVLISKNATVENDFPGIEKTNLLGNPYSTAINADQLIEWNTVNNPVFQGTLYLWNHIEEYVAGEYDADYLTYNLAGWVPNNAGSQPYSIASGQGFMILTDVSSPVDFIFKPSMQVPGKNNQFYKGKNKKDVSVSVSSGDKAWLHISHKDILRKEILIAFSSNASRGFDKGYDGKLFNIDAPITFYSLIEEDKYTIQGLNYLEPYSEIPMGFKIESPGEYSIGISKWKGNLDFTSIYILDRKLKIKHDLKVDDYIFSQIETGDIADRFKLVFKRDISSIVDHDKTIENNKVKLINLDSAFKIQSERVIREINVFNILGAKIGNYLPNSNEIEIQMPGIRKGSMMFFEIRVEGIGLVRRKTILL